MNDLLSVVQCFQTTRNAGVGLPRSGLVQVPFAGVFEFSFDSGLRTDCRTGRGASRLSPRSATLSPKFRESLPFQRASWSICPTPVEDGMPHIGFVERPAADSTPDLLLVVRPARARIGKRSPFRCGEGPLLVPHQSPHQQGSGGKLSREYSVFRVCGCGSFDGRAAQRALRESCQRRQRQHCRGPWALPHLRPHAISLIEFSGGQVKRLKCKA